MSHLLIILLSVLLYASYSWPQTVKVAVIDSGLATYLQKSNFMCKDGHKDFTGFGLDDVHGHGTHISGLIDQYAKDIVFSRDKKYRQALETKNIDYCQIIIKYYDPRSNGDAIDSTVEAIKYAIHQNVDIINYSSGGKEPSKAERDVVALAIKKGIKFIAAAGNDHANLDKCRCYYPAMYPGVVSVGNLDSDLRTVSSSNYGRIITTWEVGKDLLSYGIKQDYTFMTGTSQAAAVKSGKIVKELVDARLDAKNYYSSKKRKSCAL